MQAPQQVELSVLTIIPVGAIMVAPLASHATIIFSDTFGSGSTINGTPFSPTANSASYQNWSQGANPANFSIASGALHYEARNTSSVFAEVQAQFAATPISLTTVGDYFHLTLTFTDTLNVLLAGQNASSQLTIGLYDSGGVLPLTGSRLDVAGFASGGASNWVGYINRIFLNGNGNILTRSAQNGDLSRNQELLFNNAGTGAFNAPTATSVTANTSSFTGGLTQGNQYTLDYRIELTGASTLTISNALYAGASVAGSPLYSIIGVASGATFLTSDFDAFAFGWRRTATAAASSLDINSITVEAQLVPEPSAIALIGVGATALIGFYRRFRR